MWGTTVEQAPRDWTGRRAFRQVVCETCVVTDRQMIENPEEKQREEEGGEYSEEASASHSRNKLSDGAVAVNIQSNCQRLAHIAVRHRKYPFQYLLLDFFFTRHFCFVTEIHLKTGGRQLSFAAPLPPTERNASAHWTESIVLAIG